MYQPKTPYTEIALQTLIHYLNNGTNNNLKLQGIPDEIYKEKAGCFVSIHKLNGELRGCIGTIEPREKNLVMEISHNCISAALNDSRFSPVTLSELDDLIFSVDVLGKPESIGDLNDLDPHRFGVIISDGQYNRGVLLPGIEGVDTIEKQLAIAKKKACLSDFPVEELTIMRFSSKRYD